MLLRSHVVDYSTPSPKKHMGGENLADLWDDEEEICTFNPAVQAQLCDELTGPSDPFQVDVVTRPTAKRSSPASSSIHSHRPSPPASCSISRTPSPQQSATPRKLAAPGVVTRASRMLKVCGDESSISSLIKDEIRQLSEPAPSPTPQKKSPSPAKKSPVKSSPPPIMARPDKASPLEELRRMSAALEREVREFRDTADEGFSSAFMRSRCLMQPLVPRTSIPGDVTPVRSETRVSEVAKSERSWFDEVVEAEEKEIMEEMSRRHLIFEDPQEEFASEEDDTSVQPTPPCLPSHKHHTSRQSPLVQSNKSNSEDDEEYFTADEDEDDE